VREIKTQVDNPTDERKADGSGSKILAEVVRRVKAERAMTANWSQNWNAHGNHTNNTGRSR